MPASAARWSSAVTSGSDVSAASVFPSGARTISTSGSNANSRPRTAAAPRISLTSGVRSARRARTTSRMPSGCRALVRGSRSSSLKNKGFPSVRRWIASTWSMLGAAPVACVTKSATSRWDRRRRGSTVASRESNVSVRPTSGARRASASRKVPTKSSAPERRSRSRNCNSRREEGSAACKSSSTTSWGASAATACRNELSPSKSSKRSVVPRARQDASPGIACRSSGMSSRRAVPCAPARAPSASASSPRHTLRRT